MSKPEISETVGGYRFVWKHDELEIVVSRVKVHTSGRVTGELVIRTTKEGYNPILYPASEYNFSAPNTRKSTARDLADKYPDWRWDDIIAQLGHYMLERARAGEPMRRLSTTDEAREPTYLLEPILFQGLPTIIFGAKAVCKSTLGTVIYATLTIPWHDNPLGLTVSNRPVSGVYLDWEVNEDVAHWNARKLKQGMNLPDFDLFYRRMALPLHQDIEAVSRYMEDIAAEFVIIDSLGPAVGGDLMKPAEALQFNQALRQLNCSALIIGQTAKDPKAKVKSTFGSTYFEYYARNIFEVRKVESEGDSRVDVALFNTYCNIARRQPPMGFNLNFNGTGITIEREDVRTVAEFMERLSVSDRILQHLKSGKCDVKTIMDTLELKRNTVDQALNRLKRKGKIVKVGNEWALAYID